MLTAVDDQSSIGLMTTDTRDRILASSQSLMLKQGYNNTGISQILKDVNVPKGSFYHYFKSKEALGVAIIELYGDQQVQYVEYVLGLCKNKSAVDKVEYLLDHLLEAFKGNLEFCNCMLGNFAQELSVQNPLFRGKIEHQFHRLESIYADLLSQAQRAGDITDKVSPEDLAITLQSGWSGAIMRSKLMQSVSPLEVFVVLFFTSIRK